MSSLPTRASLLSAFLALLPATVFADITTARGLTALGTPVTENFNSLVNTGTGTLAADTPVGVGFFETGTNANAIYTAGSGSLATGDTFSFGAAGATDRALGGLQSGSLVPAIGLRLVNNTGATLTSLDIAYSGEQWRLGALARVDQLDFQYALTATSAYIDVNTLDFVAPTSAGTLGTLDGNAAANRTAKSATITGLSIAADGEIWLRWNDLNASNSDDGLAIDDFSITAHGGAPSNTAPTLTYSPSPGILILPAGSLGTVVNATIAATPADGSGSGAAATTIVTGCAITGAGAVAFGTITGAPLNFVGNTTTALTLNMSCTIAAAAASANLDCTETRGLNAPVPRTWSLTCPAATGGGITPISQVQGPGATSPLTGAVTVRGIVTAVKTNGFTLQSQDVDADASPLTSEGILVFTLTAPPAAAVVGALMEVTGTIVEFVPPADPNQPPTTELVAPLTITQTSLSNPLPTAIALPGVSPAGSFNQLEPLEHMRIITPALVVVAPSAGFLNEANASAGSSGVFFATPVGVTRPRRETGIDVRDPLPSGAPAGVPRFDSNPELLRIDSDAQVGAPALNLTVGQTLSGMTGVLDYGFRYYTFLPDVASAPLISAAASPDIGTLAAASEFTVASYNFQRFFDDINDPAINEPILTTAAYQSRLARASRQIRQNLRSPDVIGVVEMENLSALTALANKIAADGGPAYSSFLVEGNDVGGIDVGLLVKTAPVFGALPRVSVRSVTQLGASATFVDPSDSSVDTLNDRPPLLLQATINAADGTATPVSVLVNHLLSLNNIDDAIDGPRRRAKRNAQAQFVANLVQGRQTSNSNEALILVGDFNAFEFNDGYVDVIGTILGSPTPAANVVLASTDLVNPNLTRLVSTTDYSYLFAGSIQNLDHVIVNQGLLGSTSARRLEHIRINADFPEIARNDGAGNARLSDHDALVGYFNVPSAGTPILSLSVLPASISEATAPTSSTLTASISRALASNLTISLNYSGSASAADFTGPSSMTINAGSLSASTAINAVDDALIEAPETLSISAASNPAYTIGGGTSLTINSEDGGTVAPTLAFNPASGASLVLSGGGAIGTQAGSSIVISPSMGAGSGALATSTVNGCAISGSGASAFASVLGINLSFVGPTNAARSLPITCARALSPASASLSCTVRIGAAAPSSVSYGLTCPAASFGADLISITQTDSPYTQNFDSLRSGAFQSVLPPGWRFSESGLNADTTYRGSTGSDNAGDTYAYGPGSCDRAFGTLLTSSVTARIGACFVNNTGRTLDTLRVGYTGEQWRRGTASLASDNLEFQYLINPATPSVADATGIWLDANALDFTNPVTSGTANSSVDGNAAVNRALRGTDLTGLGIAPGASVCLRWLDTDVDVDPSATNSADHGLAIDDFFLIAEPGPAFSACSGLCVGDVTVTEGNAGTNAAVFNISLSTPAPVGGVQFDVRTAVETASNFDSDYVYFEQNNVSIAAGSTSTSVTVLVNGDTRAEPSETFRLAISNVRGISAGDSVGIATIATDDAYELWQVQTAGDSTPLAGFNITTQQNVVTAVSGNGFFMQTPANRSDANPLTSDAVFVFTGSAPAVAIDNLVNVTGTASDRFCSTQISAVGAGNSFSVTGSGTPIVPVQFNGNRPSSNLGALSCSANTDVETANFECFEHMRVQVQNGFVQGGNQRFPSLFSPPGIPGAAGDRDVFAEPLVTAGGSRVLRRPGFSFPGFDVSLPYPDLIPGDAAQAARIAQVPIWGGAPQVFELDPDALNPTGNQVLYGGQRFDATGVLTFEFDDFELWPTQLNVAAAPPYPRSLPTAASGELSIASLNLLRFYGAAGSNITTAIRCDNTTGSYDSYANSVTGNAEVTRRRNKLARYVIDVLRAPDVLAVQEAETLAGLQALAFEINTRNPSLGYSAYLVLGNDRSGITPGYLLRDGAGGAAARISGVAVDQLGFNDRLSSDNSCLHDRPPLRLRATYVPNASTFTVINNHTRSLLGADEPTASGARTRLKRFEQSTSIRAFVDAELTAFPTRPLIVVGDHNAYEFSDGLVDTLGIIRGIDRPALIASPAALPTVRQLSNAVDLIDPQERYSYLFDNAAQTLDHALLNNAAQAAYSGFGFARNNVDAPGHLYALTENSCANVDIQPGAIVQPATVGSLACTEGLSDHEGFVLRLFGNTPQVSVVANASQLEGNAGSSIVSANVTLTGSFPASVSILRVPYRIVGGSATLGVDYQITAPGQFIDLTSALNPRALQITVLGDTVLEADETIEIELGQPIDFATGNPAPVVLDANARQLVLTISNDDGGALSVPAQIGSADRGATGGDFVSQSLTGSARDYRYVVEVPSGLAQLTIELFDADFGAGGAAEQTDVAAGASFNAGSSVSYRALSPSTQQLGTLTGNTSGPIGANNNWTTLLSMNAPSPGHYSVRVSVPPGVLDSNGYRVRARGLTATRGGGGAAQELSIFQEGYASLGHPASGAIGTTNASFYPYVTKGCQLRTRTFDFDAASTSASSIGINASNGFSQLFNDAQLSDDNQWNTLDSGAFTTQSQASGYGIWNASVTIEGGGGTANQATLYFGSTNAQSGTALPTSNPASGSFRMYQSENGGAPQKPSLRQQLFHVSGANPASPGNPGIYRVSVQVQNPSAQALSFAAPDQLVRALVPFGGAVRYQGGAQPAQGSIVSEPSLGDAGEVLWNPGTLAAGASAELTYLIEVAPAAAGVTQVTGTFAGNTGTRARFTDATQTRTDFGPLCELMIDSASPAIPTPVTLASMRSSRSGEVVQIEFQVATQVGVAGYRIFAGTGDLRTAASDVLAATGDSLAPTTIKTQAGLSENSFYLQVLDIEGSTQWFGPFAVDAQVGAALELPSIDWDTLRAEANLARTQQAAASGLSGKLRMRVTQTGVHKISGAALIARAPGLAGAPIQNLALLDGALLVPMQIDSVDAVLSADDVLWFYGRELSRENAEGAQAWLYGKARSYLLQRGAGLLIQAQAGAFTGATIDRYQRSFNFEPQALYNFSSPAADPFAAKLLVASRQTPAREPLVLNLPNALAGAALVQAEFWGGADLRALDDHHVQLEIGGRRVAEQRFDGLNIATLRAQTVLTNAKLQLDAIVPGDNGQNFDRVFLDRIRVDYSASLTATNGQLALRTAQLGAVDSERFTDGFEALPLPSFAARTLQLQALQTPARAWLLARGSAAALPVQTAASLTRVALPASTDSESEIIAFSESAALSAELLPALDTSDLLSGSANYLIVAHPQFIAGLSSFIAAKQAQGLTVKVASTDAIYQRFGSGTPDPAAIASYLRIAKAQLGTRFVLLVGGDSYDPNNYQGAGSISFVPSPYVNLHPVVRFGAADAVYADTNSDGAPDLALGRWPVRSASELQAVISKSLQASSNRRALMIADNTDVADAFSFANVSDRVLSTLATPGERAYLDPLTQAQVKDKLLQRLAANDRLIHYFGHSGPTTWTYPAPGIINPNEIIAGGLPNLEPSVLIQWGCWNSYHVLPQYNTMAHAWLLGQRGAAAVIGAAAITDASNDALLAELLAAKLRTEPTLGEALLAAKRALAISRPNAVDVLLGTTLLGDPALVY